MIDMIGKKYGLLTVLQRAEDYICQPSGLHERQYLCKCDCGNTIIAKGHYLRKGLIISCGCTKKETEKKYFRKYNNYDLTNEYGIGYTSNTNKEFYFDLEDYNKIKEKCWSEDPSGYIYTHFPRDKTIWLHRFIMSPDDNLIVDHINHNRADNRRSNLRICSYSQNAMNKCIQKNNKSGYTGVLWIEKVHKWRAQIRKDGKNIYLGSYEKIEDAIKARREAEEKMFGDYSFKNSTGYETNEFNNYF